MSLIKLINNYSTVLFKTAIALDIQDKISQQLQFIAQVISCDQKIKKFFCDSPIKAEKKITLIKTLTDALKVERVLEKFLFLMIKNSRINILDEVLYRYRILLDKSRNIKDIKVTSSNVLSEVEKKEILQYLEKEFNQKINIEFLQEPNIIGGIIVKYDSMLIDYSISGALNRLTYNTESQLEIR